ncbi:MAG: hypothetical protein ABSC16_05120 [Candidatus Dormibacteria bacterium]|jgi:hypothetical protein
MNERSFPTEEAVNAWLAEHHDVSHASVAEVDQAAAAEAETSTLGKRAVLFSGLTHGPDSWGYIGNKPKYNLVERLAARMLLAAMSAGIKPFCPHFDEVRPLSVLCDPPSVVCLECAPTMVKRLINQPLRWQGLCDACGSRGGVMFFVQINLGNMLIAGNVCANCDRYMKGAVNDEQIGPL